jgi:hypothetical protein
VNGVGRRRGEVELDGSDQKSTQIGLKARWQMVDSRKGEKLAFADRFVSCLYICYQKSTFNLYLGMG